MFVLARAVTWATLFIAFVLVWLPARVLAWAGVTRPATLGAAQVAGLAVGAAGAAAALWCVLAFAVIGRGTPAPFDPPRRLVARGPNRFARNPMYLGAALALAGAALFFGSPALLGFTALFLACCHLFVVRYEEPTLRRLFGNDYDAYRRRVPRWIPRSSRRAVTTGERPL
jgi:protein-S-isoprenylcysteine O-methyltransferase Ste14